MAFIIGLQTGGSRPRGRRTICCKTATPTSTVSSQTDEDETKTRKTVDVAIVGGGPAGMSLAAALGTRGANVLLVDKALDKKWPNNYGVWLDEVEPLGLGDCMRKTWPTATVFTSRDRRHELDRPYGRVDVMKLKERFIQRCNATGRVDLVPGIAKNIIHEQINSVLEIQEDRPGSTRQNSVSAKVVVDATGHALRFVEFQPGYTPGYQAAYGMDIEVESHPWPLNEMLLMDFRSDHMDGSESERESAEKTPLFVYVMPMSETHVFVEETSLIAQPHVSFDFLKEQCYKRLAHHNVKVKSVLEEEFCLIPMGGGLPHLDQRVVGFGGAAGLVHPATGYMVANTLRRSECVADAIVQALGDREADGITRAKQVWQQVWSDSFLLQRDFLEFGGDLLLSMQLSELQDFFAAFFVLPRRQWSEFLSFGLIQPQDRLFYGLRVFMGATNHIRRRLILHGITKGQFTLLKSVFPRFNLPF